MKPSLPVAVVTAACQPLTPGRLRLSPTSTQATRERATCNESFSSARQQINPGSESDTYCVPNSSAGGWKYKGLPFSRVYGEELAEGNTEDKH